MKTLNLAIVPPFSHRARERSRDAHLSPRDTRSLHVPGTIVHVDPDKNSVVYLGYSFVANFRMERIGELAISSRDA